LTQEQLAHEIGVSTMTVKRWESGKHAMRRGSRCALQALAGIKRDDGLKAAAQRSAAALDKVIEGLTIGTVDASHAAARLRQIRKMRAFV